MSTLLGKSPSQMSLHINYNQPASTVRNGKMMPHRTLLRYSLSKQVTTFLEFSEICRISGCQLIPARKIPLAAVCQFFGPFIGSFESILSILAILINSIACLIEGNKSDHCWLKAPVRKKLWYRHLHLHQRLASTYHSIAVH